MYMRYSTAVTEPGLRAGKNGFRGSDQIFSDEKWLLILLEKKA